MKNVVDGRRTSGADRLRGAVLSWGSATYPPMLCYLPLVLLSDMTLTEFIAGMLSVAAGTVECMLLDRHQNSLARKTRDATVVLYKIHIGELEERCD